MNEFQYACKSDEVPDGGMKLVELDDRLVIVFRVGNDFFCLDDICTHDGGTLSDGELEDCQIACPRHGAKFDIRNGKALTMPATEDTASHEIKLDGADLLVKIAED